MARVADLRAARLKRSGARRAAFVPWDADALFAARGAGMVGVSLAHGAKGAAWLIRRHRAALRRQGAIYLDHPATKPLPKWLHLALEALRFRLGWRVDYACSEGLNIFRIKRTPR